MNSIYRKTLFSAIAGAGLAGSVSAIPKLQLDVLGGTWIGGSDETTYSTSNPFTLRALIDPSLVGRTFYLSAAIVPKQDVTPTNFGSLSIDSSQYDASVGMQYGTPPLDGAINNLQTHGIFATWYAEQSFLAGAGTVASYNVQDDCPGLCCRSSRARGLAHLLQLLLPFGLLQKKCCTRKIPHRVSASLTILRILDRFPRGPNDVSG